MAPKFNNIILKVFLLLALIFTIVQSERIRETTKMSLYFHDYTSGPNTTSLPIAGIAGKLWTFSQFGTLYVTDEPITESPEFSVAAIIARCQGIFVTAGLEGRNAHVAVSIVFTSKQYKGSTLELQGNSKQFERVREISVVSGTGMFRLARGYATFETYLVDTATTYSIVRCNVTLLDRY